VFWYLCGDYSIQVFGLVQVLVVIKRKMKQMNKSIFTLFFVLLVGFPQVSSGEGLNLFGNSGDDVIINCGDFYDLDSYVVNLKQKTIKHYIDGVHTTYEVIDVSEIYVKGRNTIHNENVTIWRFGIRKNDLIVVVVLKSKDKDKTISEYNEGKCFFVERLF
jgi:hypothetical protein